MVKLDEERPGPLLEKKDLVSLKVLLMLSSTGYIP